jgi:tetratricopeptide (TPR) repeat protein
LLLVFHNCKQRLLQQELKLSDKAIKEYRLIIGNISSAVGKYFFVRGFYEHGILLAKEGINISLELEMYESASVQYIYLIQLQLRKYDYSGVEESIYNMEKLLEVSNDSYVQIAIYWAKGRYASNRENDTIALTFYQKVEELMEHRVQQSRKKLKRDSQNDIIDEVELNEVGNLGLVYSEIGNIFENKKEFQNALEYHRKGLQILSELRDEINLLNSFYNMANCYIELNQRDKGIEFYFICIEGFLKHGNNEYLANTMAELGRNVEFNPIIAKNELLTEETFLKVFDHLNYRLKHAVTQFENNQNVSSTNADSLPIGLIGQMMLLVNLTAFSDFRSCLYYWALATKEEIDVEQEGINYFTAILNLAHAIGSYDYWVKLSEEEWNSPLKTIFVSCLIINGGPDINSKTRVFYWLAEWFKYIKLDEEATAENLWNQAFQYLK